MQRIHTLIYFKSPSCKPCERTSDVLDTYSLSQLEARVILNRLDGCGNLVLDDLINL